MSNNAPHIANITNKLWEHAADTLSTDELQWFAHASEAALFAMQNIEDVAQGIAILIGNEDDDKCPTGVFRDEQGAWSLLMFMAESVRHARSLATVGMDAHERLHHQALKQVQTHTQAQQEKQQTHDKHQAVLQAMQPQSVSDKGARHV
jgi:hypothetical protein